MIRGVISVIIFLIGGISGANGTSWGLVRLSVACMRGEPRHEAEMVSQALMGTPVRILGMSGEWADVTTPDGYRGFIIGHSLVEMTDSAMESWRSAPRAVVCTAGETSVVDSGGRHVGDLVEGCIVELRGDTVVLPDGRSGMVDPTVLTPIGKWAGQAFDPDKIIRIAESMMGIPYLWGGLSSKGLDCSGLVRACWFVNGRILPRDASQQALVGVPVERDSLTRGDLLFFGNPESGRITHVAIYDCNDEYIHSSQLVRRNSLDPESPLYLPITLLTASRVSTIPPLAGHPDYFNGGIRTE